MDAAVLKSQELPLSQACLTISDFIAHLTRAKTSPRIGINAITEEKIAAIVPD